MFTYNSLFDQFVLWLIRHESKVCITTGIVYGKKIYTKGQYKFIEIDSSKICIEGPGFNQSMTKLDDLINFARAIKEY
jgi:hypothetical protein